MDNWNNPERWYAPESFLLDSELNTAGQETKTENEQKPKRRHRWIGAVIVILVVAVSVFVCGKSLKNGIISFSVSKGSGSDSSFTIPFDEDEKEEDSGEMPETFSDYLQQYYTSVSTEKANISIPSANLTTDFRVEQKNPSNQELSFQEIYAQCADSIVGIKGYEDEKNGYAWGTGVVLSEDGLILTNCHVVNECSKAEVVLPDETICEASLVGADAISDLAVLKIEANGLHAAEFGNSECVAIGDSVVAIGNPLGTTFQRTMTNGIISAMERGISYNGRSMTLLQTNAALNEGNSGGALFNTCGQVIGITNMKMMSSYSSIEGIGFAIPTDTVESVVNSLIENGKVVGRPSLGITAGSIPQDAQEYYQLPEGVYVSSVQDKSDAKKQGIQSGDIITEVNGEPVNSVSQISDMKNEMSVGDSMDLTIWRNGETIHVKVQLMETDDLY